MENPLIKIPEVENILIKDFYILRKADIKFSPGLNLIVGKNATGKTTVINYLIKISNPNIMSKGQNIISFINNEINKNCILIDDVLLRLDDENLIKILKNLETCNRQVIATLNTSQFDFIKDKIQANIINTESFELNDGGKNE